MRLAPQPTPPSYIPPCAPLRWITKTRPALIFSCVKFVTQPNNRNLPVNKIFVRPVNTMTDCSLENSLNIADLDLKTRLVRMKA